jgi:hypothetical protein
MALFLWGILKNVLQDNKRGMYHLLDPPIAPIIVAPLLRYAVFGRLSFSLKDTAQDFRTAFSLHQISYDYYTP